MRELESLRYDAVSHNDLTVTPPEKDHSGTATERIASLDGDALEIKITVDREQARRKRFGIQLFAGKGRDGFPIMIRPETGTLRVGTTEAPFAVANLPAGEDLELRIFVDKYLVEVFANDRQAVVGAHMDYRSADGLYLYSYGGPTTIRRLEIWKLRATNQGFLEARENRIWAPELA